MYEVGVSVCKFKMMLEVIPCDGRNETITITGSSGRLKTRTNVTVVRLLLLHLVCLDYTL